MDLKVILETITINVATGLLVLIMAGGSPKLDKYAIALGIDTESEEFQTDLQYLSGAMQIENGDNGDEILLYTGSVILNRLNSPKWNGNTIEEVILAKDGGYWQYASVTRKGFKTKKASKRTKYLAKYLLIFGSVIPETVVYQGQKKNGSGIYKRCPVKGQKDEIFCYE